MNLHRVFACLSGLVALTLALFVYAEHIYLLGFPDGYVTELDAAERRLALVFIGGSVPAGLCLEYLGWMATRRKVGRSLVLTSTCYGLFLLGVALVDAYCHAHLRGGGGG